MKANELSSRDLMVGDWLMFNDKPCQVKGLHSDDSAALVGYKSPYFLIDAEPIPLTPEILEKNGFETKKIMPFKQEFEHRVGVDGRVELDNRSEYIRSNNTWSMYIRGDRGFTSYIELSFLHELQHALKLCGIDKEILV